jgi:putative sterol carrier protein
MATVAQCEEAFAALAARLAQSGPSARQQADFDRSLSCTLRDLDVIFGAQLRDGQLLDIQQVASATAQVRLTMSSDDLLAMVAGKLNLPAAWASGRVKIDASLLDIMRLRTVF